LQQGKKRQTERIGKDRAENDATRKGSEKLRAALDRKIGSDKLWV
jgi:hypothetical protein